MVRGPVYPVGTVYSLATVRGDKGLAVVFICNHCLYVQAVITRLVAEYEFFRLMSLLFCFFTMTTITQHCTGNNC